MGEAQNGPFQLSFNASLKVDFQGSRVTSDGGLLTFAVRMDSTRLALCSGRRQVRVHPQGVIPVAATLEGLMEDYVKINSPSRHRGIRSSSSFPVARPLRSKHRSKL